MVPYLDIEIYEFTDRIMVKTNQKAFIERLSLNGKEYKFAESRSSGDSELQMLKEI